MRAEILIVRDHQGRERQVARFRSHAFERIASQRRYLVSPDGKHLVHADASGNSLHVVAADGRAKRVEAKGLRDFRFTDGGRHVVAVTSEHLLRHTLANGTTRSLGEAGNVEWMEPCRDGLALLRGKRGSYEVILHRWAGTEKVLAEVDDVSRLMAARGGSRIAYCTKDELFVVADGDAGPRRLGKTHGRVTNGEMSADGSRIVLVNNRALLESKDGKAPRGLWVERGILAVWLQGSELLAGSRQRALYMRGSHRAQLPRGRGKRRPIGNLRFARDGGGGAIVVRNGKVHRWIPGRPLERLASLSSQRHGSETELLGGQRWAGGTVLWTGRETDEDEPFE